MTSRKAIPTCVTCGRHDASEEIQAETSTEVCERLARIERKLDEMKIAISGAAQLASDGEAIGMLATNRIESKLDDMLYKCDECGQMTQHRGQLNYCLTCEGLREQALEDRMHEVRR